MTKIAFGYTGFILKKNYSNKVELPSVKTYRGLHPIVVKLNNDAYQIVTDVFIFGQVKRACWDTGLEYCAISKSYAKELNLPSIDKKLVSTLNGLTKADVHLVNLKFTGGLEADDVEIIEHDFEGYDENDKRIDILIGMSVISQGDLSLTHTDDGIEFKFNFV